MTNEQKKQAEAEFAQRAANVTDEDVEDVLGKQRKVEDIVPAPSCRQLKAILPVKGLKFGWRL